MVVAYGRRVLAMGAVPDLYAYKYKGIGLCLLALARAMSGNYVNFGVFDLYGDMALKVRGGGAAGGEKWGTAGAGPRGEGGKGGGGSKGREGLGLPARVGGLGEELLCGWLGARAGRGLSYRGTGEALRTACRHIYFPPVLPSVPRSLLVRWDSRVLAPTLVLRPGAPAVPAPPRPRSL